MKKPSSFRSKMKTTFLSPNRPNYRQVLDCASPLALFMLRRDRKRQRTAAVQDACANAIKCLVFAALLLPASAPAQSLWHDDSSSSMFADKRATSVGDIITIIVSEASTASKQQRDQDREKIRINGGHHVVPLSAECRRFPVAQGPDAGDELQFRRHTRRQR